MRSLADRVQPAARRGIAIPLVLVLIVLTTILAAAALTVTAVERRVLTSGSLQSDAYALARAGLDRFLANRQSLGFTSTPPAAVESTRVQLLDGYADVVLSRLRDAQGLEPALYAIRSRGVRTDGSTPPMPIAYRSIALYARWQDPVMQLLSSWTSLRGIGWRNAGGELNGFDLCGSAPTVAGVAVPTVPGFSQASGPPVPNGSPGIRPLGPFATSPDSVRVDWARLAAGGLVAGEVDLPSDPWPGSAQWNDPNFWPVIVVHGSLVLPTDGRGLLIVTGDLTLTGGRWWRGVVLVGGRVDERAGNRVQGAIVTGLNRKLGGPALFPDSVRGPLRVQQNSCDVARALAPFRGLAAYENALADNIP